MGQPDLTKLLLPTEADSMAAGRQLAAVVLPALPDNRAFIVALSGELGAGKTTLARGFLREAGVSGRIRSPTYTLVEIYDSAGLQLVHIDLYRVSGDRDADSLGLREYDTPGAVWLVEWPERVGALSCRGDIRVVIAHADRGRHLSLSAASDAGRNALSHFSAKPA